MTDPRVLAAKARWPWLGLLAVAAVFAWVYGPALGLFFTADDFVLLQYSRDTSAADIVRTRLLALPHGNTTSPYWRPGWLLLFDAIHEGAGLDPRAFRAVVFGLHAMLAIGVYLVARRWLVRTPLLAVAACALFALSPADSEALIWIAAGINVLPAAVCLFVATAAYARYVEDGRRSCLVSASLAFLLAFTFREAAYHFPLVVCAAHACLDTGGWQRRARRALLHALPFGGVVLLHNAFFNPYAVGQLTLGENLHLTAMHGAAWLRNLFALPPGPTAIGVCLGGIAAALALLPPRGRFCLTWALVASFPFVARSHETRFLYFVHAPLALALAALAERLAGGRRAAATVAAVGLLALAGLNATRVPPAVAEAGARSATTLGVVDLIERTGLANRDELHVDFLPPELIEGLPELMQIYGGSRPRIVNHWVVARPPFLIHMNPQFAELAPEQAMLHWDAARGRYLSTTKRDLVGDRQVVPMFGFRYKLRLVADWSEVRFAPDTVHLRTAPVPPLALDASGTDTIVSYAGGTLSRIELTIEAPRDGLLVIAFIADLTSIGGLAFVDDVETPLLTADGIFNAIAIRAGSRRVVLKTSL